ncbi:mCG145002, partial [Mus musculus]
GQPARAFLGVALAFLIPGLCLLTLKKFLSRQMSLMVCERLSLCYLRTEPIQARLYYTKGNPFVLKFGPRMWGRKALSSDTASIKD